MYVCNKQSGYLHSGDTDNTKSVINHRVTGYRPVHTYSSIVTNLQF